MSKEASTRDRRTESQDRERRIQEFATQLFDDLRTANPWMDYSNVGRADEAFRLADGLVNAFDAECRRRETAIELTFGGQSATGSEPPVVTAAAATS